MKYDTDYDKILVERTLVAEPALRTTVLRLPMVHGPRDPQHRLFPYLTRMDDRRPAILLQEGLADLRLPRGFVDNVAAAIVIAMTDGRTAGRTYNVADSEAPTEAEWVRMVGRAAGWEGEIRVLPNERTPQHLLRDYRFAQQWQMDSARIRHELDYREPLPWDDALRQALAWERAHPPVDVDPAAFDYSAEDPSLGQPVL